jgi:hypothetical protein
MSARLGRNLIASRSIDGNQAKAFFHRARGKALDIETHLDESLIVVEAVSVSVDLQFPDLPGNQHDNRVTVLQAFLGPTEAELFE